MALTVRLPESLHAAGSAYAADLGISLNALLAVALRDYLDRRLKAPAKPREAAQPAAKAVAAPAVASAPAGAVQPPRSRSDPCPCGALDRRGHAVKYKHCHGRAA
jgi:hypothetical protein